MVESKTEIQRHHSTARTHGSNLQYLPYFKCFFLYTERHRNLQIIIHNLTIFSLICLWISNTVVVTHNLTAVCHHTVDNFQNKRKGFIEN